jgi:hypothetical protein
VTQGVVLGRKASILDPEGVKTHNSSRVDRGFIDEQDGNVISHRIDSAASRALERFWIGAQFQGLLAGRADQQIEEVLGNHGNYCTTAKTLSTTEVQRRAWQDIFPKIGDLEMRHERLKSKIPLSFFLCASVSLW